MFATFLLILSIYLITKKTDKTALINKYQILQKESIKNKAKQEILNLQIEDMTTIDQHYRNIRRGNHDFKNHCLVVLNMLKSHDENVKEYLLSMKDSYQSDESKK